jgi:4-hydroxymandelate oxidase
MEPVNLHEFEDVARRVLPQGAYDYYAGGADDEVTLAANREAFRRRSIRYRVLIDVIDRECSTNVLGTRLEYPVILAPTAMHKMAHPDGEAATARGAAAAGALHTVSTIATVSLEDVAAAAPGAPRWFQLYWFGDRDQTESLVKRAHAAGYTAIAVTVDLPVLGRRERDLRNAFELPPEFKLANLVDEPAEGGPGFHAWADSHARGTLTWSDIEWLRSISSLPLLLKGIVRQDDALRAVEIGVDGIWVSNHGGRQLDGSIPTLDALAEIAPAVAGRAAIVVDGGVRRGTDVLKALALGADCVAIGRPQLWGLAAGGADGVRRVLELLHDELSLAMALAGCRRRSEITPDLLA